MVFLPEIAQVGGARHIQCRQDGNETACRNAQARSHGSLRAIAPESHGLKRYFEGY
jgi:hypothetical protein